MTTQETIEWLESPEGQNWLQASAIRSESGTPRMTPTEQWEHATLLHKLGIRFGIQKIPGTPAAPYFEWHPPEPAEDELPERRAA